MATKKGKEGWIRLVQIVDDFGNPVAVLTPDGIRRLAVDAFISGGALVADVQNMKQGGNAHLTMTPALPGAGATAVSAEISMVPIAAESLKDVVITVFADQPFEVYIDESITTGGTFRRTALVATGVTNELRVIQLSRHGQDFVKVVVKNIGTGAMTILEVTHKAWEF